MTKQQFTLLTGDEYFYEITSHIAKTERGDRVALMSMGFNPAEKQIKEVVQEAINAAERGVKVRFNIDAISFMVDDATDFPTGPIFTHGNLRETQQPGYVNKLTWLDELKVKGGNWHILNRPDKRLTNPYGGRSHIKFTVINDSLYLGGCNLCRCGSTDAMIRMEDGKVANWAYDLMKQVAKNGRVSSALEGKDTSYKINKHLTLYIDAGVKYQSQIYDQALALIDSAEEFITMTCQFFPNGRTAKHLNEALKRGVKVKLYFNHPSKHSFKSPIMRLVQQGERLRCTKELFAHELPKSKPYLHAKLLASEKSAMIGSHNYVVQGVNFGTAESTLLVHDADFANEVAKLAEKLADRIT